MSGPRRSTGGTRVRSGGGLDRRLAPLTCGRALKNMFLALCTISKNPDLPRAQLSALYTKILAAKGHAHSQGSGRENFSRLARHLEQPGKHREEIL